MTAAAIAATCWLLLLTIIGLGPAMWAVSPGKRRLVSALGIAPSAGLALIGVIGFPLVRYFSPIRVWAFPVILLLAAASTILTLYKWRTQRDNWKIIFRRRSTWFTLIFLFVCWTVLISPIIINGIQYGSFRSNPSDAFFQMSWAETLRVTPWKTILEGADLEPDNIEQVKRLAQASPTSLFSARGVKTPTRFTTMVSLGVASQLFRIPVQQFYYANNLVSFFLALLLTLVIGSQLNLTRHFRYLAAAAVALGFWAKSVLEIDASAQANSVPLCLLLVVFWIQLEQESPKIMSRSRLMLAFAVSAIVCFYVELTPLIVIAFLFYYGINLIQGNKPLLSIKYHVMTLVITFAILFLSGQLDIHVKTLFWQAPLVTGLKPFVRSSPFLSIIYRDGLAAVWGLPVSILASFKSILHFPLRIFFDITGVLMTFSLALTAFSVFKNKASTGDRIVFSILSAGLIQSAMLLLLRSPWAAGKSFSYVYPYLILVVLLYSKHISLNLSKPQRKLAPAILTVWISTQFFIGSYLPYGKNLEGLFGSAGRKKPENYDLSPITEHLDRTPPELLLVCIPRTESWMFAYYSMLGFSRYPSYFQSGIIIDNSDEYQNLWLESLTYVPDYAVLLKTCDYVGKKNLGRKVSETADLVLYHVEADDVQIFNEQEKLFKKKEKEKLVWPTMKTSE